ncbi:autotransporter-associated beta strand repeat-containing protein [Luteolibacter ambystomatis]|uniref:Autotransporter-associated beta strand repeat-containing protein n=1 Tax=Luteolibacter ambystomatis TaxID=2824561 RepID=A0A975G7I7_9BACT|nr:polysaccharide lyase family 8 super-sandwich domain-containing protein [Luteolibacter ambystomatis]QUE49735.1 autotransporter-associated beta strand repeat-containing protein [Luteolibacter ambystomatis]
MSFRRLLEAGGVCARMLALVLLLAAKAAAATDMETVEARLRTQILSSTPSVTTVQGYQSSLLSTGLWSDINYSDHGQTVWAPQTHLTRLLAMAQAYNKSGNTLYQDASLKASILQAYDAWFAINPYPTSTNWWFAAIGSAQAIGNTLVLMKGDLTTAQINTGAAKIAGNPASYGGLNRVDIAVSKVCRGIAQNDAVLVSGSFAYIGSVITVTTGEGIQPDGSFQQHGAQLYNQGYGSGYFSEVLTYSVLAAGTAYQVTAAQQKILVDAILDGSQQMVRGETFDYTASGRGLSRMNQSTNGNGLISPATNALALGDYRADELQALITRQTSSRTNHTADPALALVGHRHFWRSDFSTHQRPDFYTSVKISSTRTFQPESGNNEGLKNLYLGDGVTLIMRTGNEYDDIMPAWDWRRLPGTTVEQDTRSLKPSADWGVFGTSTYAGGVSDGLYGATAFNYSRYRVAAKKSWFDFDHEFVALGAAVNASTATSAVYTTLNQCLLNGTVTYKTSSGTQTLTSGTVTPSGLKWVHHDGTGYVFDTPVNNATIQAVSQSGSWASINSGSGYSTSNVSKNVFSLHVSQSAGSTGGSYNYIVVPGVTAAAMDAYVAAIPVRTVRNDATVQAVDNDSAGITQAAFYGADSITIAPGRTLSANGKAVVQVYRQPNNLQITSANPEALAMTLQVSTTGLDLSGGAQPDWFDSLGTATSTVNHPGGTSLGGTSIGLTLANDGAASPTITLANTIGSSSVAYSVPGSAADLTLAGNTTFQPDTNTTLELGNAIQGAFSLAKAGGGTVNLSGSNSYTGATIVNAGVVNLTGDHSAATGGWSIGNSANSTTATASFQAGSKIDTATGKSIVVNQAGSSPGAATLNVAGTVTNAGALSLVRAATANFNSGASWTQGGSMDIGPSSGTSYGTSVTVNSGATFSYNGTSAISLHPSSAAAGTTSLNLAGGTFTTARGFSNPVASSSGAANLVIQGGGTLKLSADVPTLATTAGSALNFQIGTGGGTIHTNGFNATLETVVSGTGALTKNGAGTLTLTGTNTYSGGTVIPSNGGMLVITRPAALGTGAITLSKSSTVTGSLALQFTGTNTLANTFSGFNSTTFNGDATQPCIENLSGITTITSALTVTGMGGNGLYVKSSGGFLTLAGTISHTVASVRSFGLGGAGDGVVTGNILDGSGGFPLVKDGTGTWTLAGTNSYSGSTTINGGTLRIGNGGATGTLGVSGATNNATLEVCRSNAYTISNAISGTGSFVQSGSGTTTLTGANSYSGDTRVTGGSLVISSAMLADAGAVEISSAATLKLGFAGSDTVQSLSFDGELQLAGTWGSIGSGAEHETVRITGTGLLLVVSGEDPFVVWMDGFPSLAAQDKAATADPDHDGFNNLVEFALHLDPSTPNALSAPTVTGNSLKWRYTLNPGAGGITVVPEWSTDLITWHSEGITTMEVGDDGGTLTMEASVPRVADEKKFLRLRVTR